MSPSKPFQMRLDDETRARWQAAADGSLARFVKEAVEEKIQRDALDGPNEQAQATGRVVLGVAAELPDEVSATLQQITGGKLFKGPDPKEGRKK